MRSGPRARFGDFSRRQSSLQSARGRRPLPRAKVGSRWKKGSPVFLPNCSCQNLSAYLHPLQQKIQYGWRVPQSDSGASLGEHVLSALQSAHRDRTKISRCLFVCADSRNQAQAKVRGTAHLLLSTMLGLAGHGASAGGCTQYGSLGNDSRARIFRPGSKSGSLGEPECSIDCAAANRHGWSQAFRTIRRILRVLRNNRNSPSRNRSYSSFFLANLFPLAMV